MPAKSKNLRRPVLYSSIFSAKILRLPTVAQDDSLNLMISLPDGPSFFERAVKFVFWGVEAPPPTISIYGETQ